MNKHTPAFTYDMVPLCPSRARYFVRRGAKTKFGRGFRSKAEVDVWFDELRASGALDWRAGANFRLRGDDTKSARSEAKAVEQTQMNDSPFPMLDEKQRKACEAFAKVLIDAGRKGPDKRGLMLLHVSRLMKDADQHYTSQLFGKIAWEYGY